MEFVLGESSEELKYPLLFFLQNNFHKKAENFTSMHSQRFYTFFSVCRAERRTLAAGRADSKLKKEQRRPLNPPWLTYGESGPVCLCPAHRVHLSDQYRQLQVQQFSFPVPAALP
jgi:hypothetical protein